MIFLSCFRVMVINRLHSKQGYKGTTIFQKQREENASTHKHNLKRDKGKTIILTLTRERPRQHAQQLLHHLLL